MSGDDREEFKVADVADAVQKLESLEASEKMAARLMCEALERWRAEGRPVIHLETGVAGKVARVWPDGCARTREDKPEYMALEAGRALEQNGVVVNGIELLEQPVVVLEDGNAFWIKPRAFAPISERALALRENLHGALSQILVGFAVAAKSSGIAVEPAAALAASVLAAQCRELLGIARGEVKAK